MKVTNRVFVAKTNRIYFHKLQNTQLKLPKRRFPGAILRSGYGTCLIFRSGRIIFNGIKSRGALTRLHTLCENVIGHEISSPQLVNMCSYINYECFDMSKLYDVWKSYCKMGIVREVIFTPDLHPGIMIKWYNCSIIAYHNCCIITGCRDYCDTLFVSNIIKEVINMCSEGNN